MDGWVREGLERADMPIDDPGKELGQGAAVW